MDYYLQQLEKKSIYILREAKAKFKNVAILWAMDKNSTLLLALCRRAFFGRIPFPVIHLDNGHDFPETYAFQKKIVKEWGVNSLVAKVEGLNKAEALKKLLDEKKFDVLVVSTQKDEHKDASHIQIHPLLHWTEADVWMYTKEKNLPFNPLYLAKNGKRYRSLGYLEATSPVESNAKTVDDIIKELKIIQVSERQGRIKDGEKEEIRQRLRELGYIE